jgi:uncharacterized protein YggE
MRNFATLAAASAMIAAPMAAQAQTPIGQPILTVEVVAETSAKPDVAILNAGVVTDAPTAEAALAENAKRMQAVIGAAKRAGVAERDVQTASISVNPQYVYAENQPPRLTGYQAQNSVRLKVRDMKKVGAAIDALAAQGSNQINGISFEIDKPDAVLDVARKDAVAKARSRADVYAQAAGLTVDRLVSMSETEPPHVGPIPMMATAREGAMATPVEPGEVELSTRLIVIFAQK